MDYFLNWCLVCEKRIEGEALYCSQSCQFHDFCAIDCTKSHLHRHTSSGLPQERPISPGASTSINGYNALAAAVAVHEMGSNHHQLPLSQQRMASSMSMSSPPRSPTASPSSNTDFPQLLARSRSRSIDRSPPSRSGWQAMLASKSS